MDTKIVTKKLIFAIRASFYILLSSHSDVLDSGFNFQMKWIDKNVSKR